MSQLLVSSTPVKEVSLPASVDVSPLVQDWLSSLSERTRLAYRQDLEDFADFMGLDNGTAALLALVAPGQAGANLIALRYRTHLQGSGLAPSTINRRLSALRSAVGMLRIAGVVACGLEVKALKAAKYRDTRGPGISGIRALLRVAQGEDLKALRDRALILTLFGMGLRRNEVVTLDVSHLDIPNGRLFVAGKGSGGVREAMTVPKPALRSLSDYLSARGNPPDGPLFLNVDRSRKGPERLTGDGVRRILASLALTAGLGNVRPHGLRHASITAALDAGMDIREVLKFSRHKDPRTLMHYDDSRKDIAGEVASVVVSLVGPGEGGVPTDRTNEGCGA